MTNDLIGDKSLRDELAEAAEDYIDRHLDNADGHGRLGKGRGNRVEREPGRMSGESTLIEKLEQAKSLKCKDLNCHFPDGIDHAIGIFRQHQAEQSKPVGKQQPASSLVEALKAASFDDAEALEDGRIIKLDDVLAIVLQHTREPDVETGARAIWRARQKRILFPVGEKFEEMPAADQDMYRSEAKACYLAAGWTVKE